MLTRRKKEFINQYILTKNATESAKLAGYSLKTAYSTGSRLLKNVEVNKAIETYFQQKQDDLDLSRENYQRKTLENYYQETHPSVKARYWEMFGKSRGYLSEPEQQPGQDLFSMIAKDLHLSLSKDVRPGRQDDSQ